MGQYYLTLGLLSESSLKAYATEMARILSRQESAPLLIGLEGELGSGKTTWVRAMLRGAGFEGQVPSPTYALVEPYHLDELTIAHLDLYRLTCREDLDNLGIRDWFSQDRTWLLIEWPDRVPALKIRCDVLIQLKFVESSGRFISLVGQTHRGRAIVKTLLDPKNNSSINL